jgi:hypothetical protein
MVTSGPAGTGIRCLGSGHGHVGRSLPPALRGAGSQPLRWLGFLGFMGFSGFQDPLGFLFFPFLLFFLAPAPPRG